MIKNKELLELIERKKNETSCDNCIHCNLNAYNRGRWYCMKRGVFKAIGSIQACFERR